MKAVVQRVTHSAVQVESQQIGANGLAREIEAYSPDLIGITSTSPVYSNAKYLARIIKESFSDIPIGIGGVHSTIVGKKILQESPYFDFQVVGEGEKTITEIIEALNFEFELELEHHKISVLAYAMHQVLKDNDGVFIKDRS